MSLDFNKISVVVLTYNGWDYTHQLLSDIHQKLQDVAEVIVVDNGSTDKAVCNGLKFWKTLDVIPLRVIYISKNDGFIGGMNLGISRAIGDVVIALSNDIRIYTKGIVPFVRETFSKNEKSLIGAELHSGDTGWNSFKGEIFPYLNGHVLIGTKEFWNASKGFDTLYYPSDFEDVDLSTYAIRNGYSLVELPKGTLHHIGGATYKYDDERRKRTEQNRIKFATKWGIEI